MIVSACQGEEDKRSHFQTGGSRRPCHNGSGRDRRNAQEDSLVILCWYICGMHVSWKCGQEAAKHIAFVPAGWFA